MIDQHGNSTSLTPLQGSLLFYGWTHLSLLHFCSADETCGPGTQTWPCILVLPYPSWLFLARSLSFCVILVLTCNQEEQFIFVFLNLEIIVPESISEGQTQLLPFVPRRVLGRITVGAQICLFLMLRLGLHSHQSVVIRSTGS